WGVLAGAPFLPRLVNGRVVLAFAQWHLSADESRDLTRATGADRYRAAQILRERRHLPRWVTLVDGDRRLPADPHNPLAVAILAAHLRRQPGITLAELFPAPHQLCARGPEGRFVHELLIPFRRSDRLLDTPDRQCRMPASARAGRDTEGTA